MLRIEKLFLQGFKSFCDPTEVIFDEEGITAVVGPNGCGKSNVADAISWVIGEQRAKALRGGKMEDVIFQGSRSRQPSGMAEVLLTMIVHETFEIRAEPTQQELQAQQEEAELAAQEAAANEAAANEAATGEAVTGEAVAETLSSEADAQAAGAEPAAETPETTETTEAAKPAQKKRRKTPTSLTRVFHEGERITVGRRLYRTGESEYEMNGRQCRLRDVQDLFAGTGLGGAHYAIIEQGRIGQVLSAKPMDRRALIEEAAGVSKFKMRQHQAELKLEASKQNLSRITDILTEIERQQNSLKRQAARARRYQRLRQETRDLMRSVYVVDYRATRQTITDVETALTDVAKRETEFVTTITQLEEAQADATQKARTAEEALNESRQLAATVDLEVARAKQQHSYLTEQLQSLGVRAEQFARDQASISERGQFITQESTRLREELRRLEEEINTENKLLTEAEAEHRAQTERESEAERRLEEGRKKVYDCVTQLERWRQLKRQFSDSVERSESRLRGLGTERERAAAQAQSARDQHAELTAQLEEKAERQQTISHELANVTSRLAEARRLRETLQTKLNGLQRELSAAEHRLKSLTQIDERRTYFSEAVQVLMKHGRQGNGFRTLGTLADFLHVSPEHETMIESALRDELQYVVVPTFDDALHAIDFLKSEGGGRATFLVVGMHGAEPVGTTSDGNHSGHNATLASLLGLRPEFAEAFNFALPTLANALIVDDAGQAVTASVSQNGSSHGLVSLARTGERVVAGRLITGGSGTGSGLGVLALKREIGELGEKQDALADQVHATEIELSEAKTSIAQLEDAQRQLDSEARQIEKQLAVQREQLQQRQRELERATTHIRVVEQEIAQAETERQEFEGKLQHATAQTGDAEQARTTAEQQVEVIQAELAEMRRAAEQRGQELSRRRAEFAAKTERRRGWQNDIRRLENEANDLNSRLNRSRLEAIEADDKTQTMQTTLYNTALQLEELTEQQQFRASELEERSGALASARQQVEAIEQDLRAAREGATQARELRAQKEIEQARLSSNLDHLIQACHAELGENIVEVCERLAQSQAAAEAAQAEAEAGEVAAEGAGEATTEVSTEVTEAVGVVETAQEVSAEAADDEDTELDDESAMSFWQVPEDFDLEVAKTRLDELRAKIEALGPVNMMALEELTEIEERFHFLTTQKADIEKAIADTQSAIAEIKKRSRERFTDAFYAINTNFKQMFQELFGGGQGEMRLIDETDVLESGIEIIAQPPGKRLQNVLLLSGGEKAMTAMALVLAIFKYRPSPFCLLDEVDAPLDEMNIGRFADKVLEMSNNTQFMVITHSKRTMEAARTLYGVTMEDPGVSKLISVRLS